MRTRKAQLRGFGYALALLLAGTALAPADDIATETDQKPVPQVHSESIEMTRKAVIAYREGRYADAIPVFELAAANGHVPAQWKLARMLARGDGIEADPARAAQFFTAIAERFADTDPDIRLVPYVADATREAGRMQLAGAAGPRAVRAARSHLHRAATLYRDVDAQYLLALSLKNADHGRTSDRNAIAWLRNASRRGHIMAAAALGEMVIAGQGTKPDPTAGLLLIAHAAEKGTESQRASLALRFQAALAKADEPTRIAITSELARLGLEAATTPVMAASTGG